MIRDMYIFLQAQNLRIPNIRPVDKRAEKQEREDWQDTVRYIG